MERIHYRISLDMFDTVSRKTLKAKKGDTACDIIITLTENGKVYQIADGCTANFTAKKPDGNFLYNTEACSIKDNAIIYNFTEQTTACEGMVDCEVVLYGADGNRLTSPRFALQVGGTVYNGEEIISTPETDMMKELIEDAEEAIENVNKVMPETLPPFNIPMGHPDGSGRSIDSQMPIYRVVDKRSFVGNGYELIMVNPIQDENGKVTTTELVGSGIRFDEVALKNEVASKEAVATKQGKTETMKHIVTITLEETVPVVQIDFPDKPIYKEFFIKTDVPACASGTAININSNCEINKGGYFGTIRLGISSSRTRSWYHGVWRGSGWEGISCAGGISHTQVYSMGHYPGQGVSPLTNLIFTASTSNEANYFPIGTVIKIYGW